MAHFGSYWISLGLLVGQSGSFFVPCWVVLARFGLLLGSFISFWFLVASFCVVLACFVRFVSV